MDEEALLHTYKALREPRSIRLLRLEPGKDNDKLRAHLEHHQLDQSMDTWKNCWKCPSASTKASLFAHLSLPKEVAITLIAKVAAEDADMHRIRDLSDNTQCASAESG
jgi:hypothetical protein